MKTKALLLLTGFAATQAWAGFQDPSAQGGAVAPSVNLPMVHPIAPEAVAKNAKENEKGKPKATKLVRALPQKTKALPQVAKVDPNFYGPMPEPGFQAPKVVPVPTHSAAAAPAAIAALPVPRTPFPWKSEPVKSSRQVAQPKTAAVASAVPAAKAHAANRSPASVAVAPVPSAPALPLAAQLSVPVLSLPARQGVSVAKDATKVIHFNGHSHDELLAFVAKARSLPLPQREHPISHAGSEIAAHYEAALHPQPHQAIRTAYALHLEKVAKISNPPAPIQYENTVKRIDALFNGLDLSYPKAIVALWELSQSPTNGRHFQARDALFAGILSQRAGWEAVAGNQLADAASKKLDREDRYLSILFAELQNFQSISHIDRVIENLNPARVALFAPKGDKANFAMARRVLAGRADPALPSFDFQARIADSSLRDRVELLRALAKVRVKGSSQDAAIESLHRLEAESSGEVQQEARLGLARALLQKGEPQNALALYRAVNKDGKNRLEVLSEQSYAEFKAGQYQDSLGKSMGLQSPYFQYGFAPDVHMVEVLSRKSMCDFGGAEAGLQRFNERYQRELAALQDVLSHRNDPKAFYPELISYHNIAEPMRYQRFLLRIETVMENQKVLNEAQKELAAVDWIGVRKHTQERPAGWDQFAAFQRKVWEKHGVSLEEESARSALAEADYMVKRLQASFGQAELIALDLASSASKNYNLQSALNFPVRKLASAEIDKDKFHWPFEEEIWEDELDYLKMKNPSKCASATAKPIPVAAN